MDPMVLCHQVEHTRIHCAKVATAHTPPRQREGHRFLCHAALDIAGMRGAFWDVSVDAQLATSAHHLGDAPQRRHMPRTRRLLHRTWSCWAKLALVTTWAAKLHRQLWCGIATRASATAAVEMPTLAQGLPSQLCGPQLLPIRQIVPSQLLSGLDWPEWHDVHLEPAAGRACNGHAIGLARVLDEILAWEDALETPPAKCWWATRLARSQQNARGASKLLSIACEHVVEALQLVQADHPAQLRSEGPKQHVQFFRLALPVDVVALLGSAEPARHTIQSRSRIGGSAGGFPGAGFLERVAAEKVEMRQEIAAAPLRPLPSLHHALCILWPAGDAQRGCIVAATENGSLREHRLVSSEVPRGHEMSSDFIVLGQPQRPLRPQRHQLRQFAGPRRHVLGVVDDGAAATKQRGRRHGSAASACRRGGPDEELG
mmetsp:Transcript_146624/g.470456  ORF Transcript_146624/g.470456 Transcript_146624/m.470456 type:complete len:429 (+) Transcript_146624:639-1925(+)